MYQWWKNILNAMTTYSGDQFLNNTNGGEHVTEDNVNKFMADMTKYNDLNAKLDGLFELLNDVTADRFCPMFCDKLTDKTPYPDFLKS